MSEVSANDGVASKVVREQSLVSILFKSGNRSEYWYSQFTTEVNSGEVVSLTYTFADQNQSHHHIALSEIEMITVKQTKPL